MEFILSKLLSFLLKPIFWVVILFVFGVLSKRKVLKKRLLVAGLLVLMLFSNTFIVNKAFNVYEVGYPVDKNYDVGVLLGGFSSLNKKNNKIAFGFSSDRLFQAVLLYKQQKIKQILISSGNANLIDTAIKEADLAATYLKELGIPDNAIIVERNSRNTIENAKFSAQLINSTIPKASILVITSAWHIPRTSIIFSRFFTGDINYYPTNYIGKSEYNWSDFLVPNAEALGHWEILFKEWTGLVVDRFRN